MASTRAEDVRIHACDYDARASAIITTLRLLRSILPATIFQCDFGVFFGLHIFAWLLFYWGRVPGFQHNGKELGLLWKQVQGLSTITIFLTVFYLQACFKRYILLYRLCRELLVKVTTACFHLRLHLVVPKPGHVRLSVRYLLSGVLLYFQDENCRWHRQVDTIHEVLEKAGYSLTRVEERDFFATLKGSERYLVAISWAVELCRLGAQEADLPANITMDLVTKMYDVCEAMQVLSSSSKVALVPFQYFQMLNLVLCVSLLMWAYCMAATMSYSSIVLYPLCETLFMGMRVLASQLADPFGSDMVDFPLADWLYERLEDTIMITEYRRNIRLRDPRALNVSDSLYNASFMLETLAKRQSAESRKQDSPNTPGADLAEHRSFEDAFTPEEKKTEKTENEQEVDEGDDDEG